MAWSLGLCSEAFNLMTHSQITQQDIEDLTLALLYLNAWRYVFKKDNMPPGDLTVWKGHDFDTLDALNEKEFIVSNYKNKSLNITDEGERKAQEIIRRLLGKEFTVTAEVKM